MSDEEKVEAHESFGLMSITRLHGSADTLFGSDLKHHNTIEITIKRAERHRDLHKYWYFGREDLIRIEMSPVQFSEIITTMNHGDGRPVTIRTFAGRTMEKVPGTNQKELIQEEFSKDCKRIARGLDISITRIKTLLEKPNISKRDREEITKLLGALKQDLTDNLPYAGRSFTEAMEKVSAEAKGEIEAFFGHIVTKLGIQSLEAFNEAANQALDATLELPQLTE